MNLKNKSFEKRIIAIAMPIILSNLVSQVEMLVDRMFLGRLDISCMSAVSNASSPLFTVENVIFTLSVGTTILMSQMVGANNKEKAKEYASAIFKYSSIIGLVMFALWLLFPQAVFKLMGTDSEIIDMSITYARYFSPIFLIVGISSSIISVLEVSEKTKILTVYGIIRSVANFILDYALIFGHFNLPAMGVGGAALATTIANYIGAIVILVYVVLNKELWLMPNFKEIIKAKWQPYFESIKKGLPSALEEFMWQLGMLFMIAMLNKISLEASGIYSIIFGVELLPVCVFGGLGNAVLTLAGQETGKGNYEKIKTLVRIAVSWSIILGIFNLLMFKFYPETIISCFTSDKTIIETSSIYLIIVGFDLFPKALNILTGSGIRGYGDTKWMLKTQFLGTVFVITFSAILVIGFKLSIASLFILTVVDESLRSALNIWKLNRISRSKSAI